MNYLSLILRIVAILSAAITVVLYFSLKGKVEEKETELLTLRTEFQTLTDKSESANLEIAELEEELSASLALADEVTAQVEATKAEMFAKMQENQRVQSELTAARMKTSQLEATALRLRQELVNAERVAAAASQESVIAQLGERVEELTVANTALREQIRGSESFTKSSDPVALDTDESGNSLDSAPPIIQKLTPKQLKAIKEETKIASLSTANGLIVLNTDEDLQLTPGTIITLVKDSEAVAKVKIINTNGSLAIANILPGSQLDGVSKGDTVKILR